MAETIKDTLSGAKGGWNKIDSKKKKILIGIVIIMIILAIWMGSSGSRVDYSLLFSNMELDDAGAIVNDLDAKKIKYILQDNGKTILIEKSMVDSYRMDLAVSNMLPESSTGFEIFDDTGLMVTDEDRQIMYQRALTGELQRTIASLDGISSAKVHLVIPQKSIFEAEARHSSASVVIDTKAGYNIPDSAIRGIAALVSSSVDNMPIENIQIISSNGTILSNYNKESAGGISGYLDEYSSARASFQKEIEDKLYSLLGSVYGFDKVTVSVLAELDFDSEESTIVTYYDPVIRSEQVTASGNGTNRQEVTGGSIDDNISNVFEGEEGKDYSYSNTTNNELSTETKNYIKAPGKINKLTTAIVYNGELNEKEKTNIQSIVAGAIGYDGERGDFVSVVAVDVLPKETKDNSNNVVTENAESFFEKNMIAIIAGSVLLLLIIVILFVVFRKKDKKDHRDEANEIQKMINDGINIDDAFNDVNIDDIVMKPNERIQKAKKYAETNPKLAADLIRTWIKE